MQQQSRRFLVILLFIGFISLGLPDGLLGVAWPSIADEQGVRLSALGGLSVAFSVGFLTASILSGRLLGWLGVGQLLALCGLATGLSLLGFTLVPVWWMFLLIAVVFGMGGGAIDAGLNAYAAEHYDTRVLSWMHACYGIGATIGPLLMGALIAGAQPWQTGYMIVAAAQLSLAAAFFLTRKRWDGQPRSAQAPSAAATEGEAIDSSLGATLRRPIVWLGGLVFVLYTGFEVVIGQWSFSLLTLDRGVEPTIAAQWIGVYWGGLTLGRIVAGVVANRVSSAQFLWGGGGFAALGAVLIWLDLAGSWLSLLGLGLAGFALAPLFPALIATTAERVGRAHAANAIGLQVAAANIGAAALPWLVGQAVGWRGVGIVGPAIAWAALLYVGCFVLLVRSARPKTKPDLSGAIR